MPTGVITEDLTLQVEVPVVSLQVGETICKNPKDTSTEVVWKVTGREESDGLVFTYRALDGVEDSLTFEDLGAFVWVDLGPVNK